MKKKRFVFGIVGIIATTAFWVISCNTRTSSQERKDLINRFITAVEKYDTAALYNLLDTGSYFKVDDKEGLWNKIEYMNRQFKTCGSSVRDSAIKIRKAPVNNEEYLFRFCRGQNGELLGNSFDLVFTFEEYKNNRKIHFIDLVTFRKTITPIAPLPDVQK
jgi:hypothetical protein